MVNKNPIDDRRSVDFKCGRAILLTIRKVQHYSFKEAEGRGLHGMVKVT